MGTKLTRKNLAKYATIHLNAEPDDLEVRGNALASGDDAVDKACEDEIIARIDSGDVWAWAAVEVYAEIELESGYIRGESDYLGACSYASEADFRTAGGYWDDMREVALDNLWAAIQDISKR